jgi:hypothetical protein
MLGKLVTSIGSSSNVDIVSLPSIIFKGYHVPLNIIYNANPFLRGFAHSTLLFVGAIAESITLLITIIIYILTLFLDSNLYSLLLL